MNYSIYCIFLAGNQLRNRTITWPRLCCQDLISRFACVKTGANRIAHANLICQLGTRLKKMTNEAGMLHVRLRDDAKHCEEDAQMYLPTAMWIIMARGNLNLFLVLPVFYLFILLVRFRGGV